MDTSRYRRRPVTGVLAALVFLATAGGMVQEARAPELDASAVQAYCSLFLDLERFSHPGSGYETLPNEEQYRIARQLAEVARPLVESLHRLAPRALRAETAVLVEGVEEVARTGDFRILGLRGGQAAEEDIKLGELAARVRAALDRLHAYNLANCGWRRQDVVGVDDTFREVPAELRPGLTSFEFHNRGTGPHTMALERLDKGAGLGELLRRLRLDYERRPRNQPPREVEFPQDQVTYFGEAFAPPGKRDHLVADLTPGEYVLVCFVPEGSTYVSEENETIGTGPPHALLGMVQRVTVR